MTSASLRGAVKYPARSPFHAELDQRVDDYFATSGHNRHGGPRMWLKTGLILAWLVASYALLLFWASTAWAAVALTVSGGLAIAAVGFNVMHDGGHGSYSQRRGVNRVMAVFIDLIGGSSYVWRWQHNVIHHTYTNIDGVDEDISIGSLARLAPDQVRRPLHRFQHVYVWFLYGFLALKWWFVDDFVAIARGQVGRQSIPRPKGRQLAVLLVGKLQFFAWTLLLPLLLHAWYVVLPLFVLGAFVVGATMSVVFQLAHCNDEASFPSVSDGARELERPFDESQVETTVDFCPRNPVVTWLVGGLNFQIEHHLFPRICHVHYPALAPIVRATCAEYGVRYVAQPSLGAALGSHARWLRTMGMAA